MASEFLYAVEREYPVSIDELWSAWVDASKLEQWYCPLGFSIPSGTVVSDARVGGKWSVAVQVPDGMSPDPSMNVHYFWGRYTKFELNRELEHTMHYAVTKDEFDAFDETSPHHLVLVEFEDRGNSSWCKFSQFGELPEGNAEMAKAGMTSYFDNLQQFLSK